MKIKFFAHLQNVTGCREIDVAPPPVANEEALWKMLCARFPALVPHRAATRLAVNSSYAATDTVFRDADEVALIPPVSGG